MLFPGDQGRIEAATETMTKISDSIGSERFLGMYRDFINNQADLSQEDKKMMLDAAEVGSFMSIPGAGGAVAAGRDVIQEGVVKAGQAADARIAERAQDTGTTLTSGVDPTPAIDAALSAAGRAVRPSANNLETSAIQKFAFFKNKEGGQDIGNKQIIVDIDKNIFENYVRPLLDKGMTYEEFEMGKMPGGLYENMRAAFTSVNDGDYKLTKVDDLKNLQPDQTYAIQVNDFNSPDAVTRRQTADSDVIPLDAIDQVISATGKLLTPKNERQTFTMAPENVRAHKSPPQLLVAGNGEKATIPVTQAYNANNKQINFANIDALTEQHPNALSSAEEWLSMEQAALGGEYLPHPPMQAIKYAQDPNLMAEKLRKLTPELKAGVDEGFAYVDQIRQIYKGGSADPKMTADLFVWGILSRGAGPTQQEAAFLDIMQDAQPMMAKVVDGTFTADDAASWTANMKKSLPEGSPGKQVTMNVNAAGALLRELAKVPEGSNQTVLETLHGMLADENVTAKMIRRKFMELTDSAGIDNKVVSFVLLVAGRDDVLVMDRIQGRHLWDDGRFDGFNIYDGYYKEGTTVQEGLQGIFRGPRGVLVTEMLENGMRPNVQKAYEMVGRPQDASLGRFHWETWVIEGEQVVSHSTLDSIAKNTPVGGRVTEGKTDEFASGLTYIRGSKGPVQEYTLSNGDKVYMDPVQTKKFLKFIKSAKAGIIPKDFKVTERADIPWYERPEVNRENLDRAARDYANATPDGAILPSSKGANKSADTTRRGSRKRGVDNPASNGGG